MLKNRLPLLFVFPLSILIWLFGNEVEEEYFVVDAVIIDTVEVQDKGATLAAVYCATCHKLPKPESLDKSTWGNSVLPNMGLRLGLKIDGKNWYDTMSEAEADIVKNLKIYPEYPLISKQDWDLVKKYYIGNAPKELPAQSKRKDTSNTIFPFSAQTISIGDSKLPQVSLLRFNPETSELYIGDFQNLITIDNRGNITNKWNLESPASDIGFVKGEKPLLLSLGKLSPSDQALGKLSRLDKKTSSTKNNIVLSNLKRPVNFQVADLNNDGKEDLVLCSFGHYGGKLSWLDDFDSSKEYVLNTLPGTRKVEISDFNGDGRPDIMALMTQAREQITMYYNQGNNEFKEHNVLSFDAVNGTSYFELADFNGDGYQDILVTNGDNRDYSPIDKPYHGIRVYINDGKNEFKEAYFFPMYDCGKAMTRDFDGDGDLDIIGAALYSEYTENRNAKESVVYLENKGGLNFKPSYMDVPIHGNWLTMDVGDFNADSNLDIMLGTFIYNIPEMMSITKNTGTTSFPQVLLLTNLSD